ncbi:MAG: substrate-binding domain-containing protein [Edaphobacter sp.]
MFQGPSLSTVRQPLRKMGSTAARTLLKKLAGEPTPDLIQVDPELIVRESTAPPSTSKMKKATR